MYRQVKFAFLVVAAAMLSTLGMVSSAWAVPVALTPSTFIDVSSGSGTGVGFVSTGHQIFHFDANAGDLVTLDIDVTAAGLGGATDSEPDSQLFLFDSSGALLAENDDFQGRESKIVDFLLQTTGTFYAGVTTYNNDPIFTNGVISGWADDGGSDIEYNLIITRSSSVPEPGTLALVALGLTGLGWARRGRKA
jgi:hypothetical protein